MRIAILEFNQDQKSATGVRGRAMRDYLIKEGYSVDILSPTLKKIEQFHRDRYGLTARIKRRISGRPTLPHLWDFIADQLDPQIRRGQYDVLIGRGQDMAYVLTRPFKCVKILDLANILFLESYYVWGPNLAEVEETYNKEMQIFRSVDYISCHHELLTCFLIQQFDKDGYISRKSMTIRMGCDYSSRQAQFSHDPRIIYAGSYYYIQDPYLLAFLTKISPFPIDCYGPSNPNASFLPAPLSYKGYTSGVEFYADYQFGLITVSRDLLRQNSPSTKFAYYFACGLPVLFPEWMKEGFTYPGCAVPYNEESFVEQVKSISDRETWQRMSNSAIAIARDLKWDKVLKPLGDLLSTHREGARTD